MLAGFPARRLRHGPGQGPASRRAPTPTSCSPTWARPVLRAEDLLDRHGLSPRRPHLHARVVRTILRGPRFALDGRLVGDRPRAPGRRGARHRRRDPLHAAIAELAAFNDDPAAGGITREVYTPTYAAALEWVAERCATPAWRRAWTRSATSSAAGRAPSPRAARAHRLARRHDAERGALRRRARRAGRDRGGARAARAGRAPAAQDRGVAWAGEEPRFGTGSSAAARRRRAAPRRPRPARRSRRRVAWPTRCGRRPRSRPARRGRSTRPPCTRSSSSTSSRASSSRPRRADRRRHRDRRAARLPADLPGAATHAGATPMALRRDALAGAAEVIVALERLARGSAERHDGRHRRRAARAPGRDQRRAGRGRARRRRARQRLPARERVVDGILAAAREIASAAASRSSSTPIVARRARRLRAGDRRGGRGGVRASSVLATAA